MIIFFLVICLSGLNGIEIRIFIHLYKIFVIRLKIDIDLILDLNNYFYLE